MGEFSDRLVGELIDAVKAALRKEQSERLRDVYLIGDIEKDTARTAIERIRELASESRAPITLYLNTAGGNVTDGLALHDAVQQIVADGRRIGAGRPGPPQGEIRDGDESVHVSAMSVSGDVTLLRTATP